VNQSPQGDFAGAVRGYNGGAWLAGGVASCAPDMLSSHHEWHSSLSGTQAWNLFTLDLRQRLSVVIT
jgi:hypothetical protein